MIARQITVQFVKGGSRTSSGRSITRFIRDVRSIIIPVRNEIFRQVLIRKDEVIYFLRLVEILLIFSVAVTSSISVQGPGLSASPGGFVRISLRCLSLTHFACFGIIIHNMITTVVRTEVMSHGRIRMFHCNIIESRVTGKSGCLEQ